MQIKCQNKSKLIERHHILNSNGKTMTLGEYLGSESATLCLPGSRSANIFDSTDPYPNHQPKMLLSKHIIIIN